jgi:hypothetical protein
MESALMRTSGIFESLKNPRGARQCLGGYGYSLLIFTSPPGFASPVSDDNVRTLLKAIRGAFDLTKGAVALRKRKTRTARFGSPLSAPRSPPETKSLRPGRAP